MSHAQLEIMSKAAEAGESSDSPVAFSFAKPPTSAGETQMNKHHLRAITGLIMATMASALIWSGYRTLGFVLGCIAIGICFYGVGGGILTLVKESRREEKGERSD